MAYDGIISFRPDTKTNWENYNDILAKGEAVIETDTGNVKIGDGSSVYTALDYISAIPKLDTKANWTTKNLILMLGQIALETDTGNIKIGDGSTAWASLNYHGQDTALPIKYDISTTNKTVTLDLLSGGIQKRSYKWTGGDGTYKLTFSVPNASGTYSTSVYEGEGEGVITFEATNTDSGLAWEVTKYEDSGSNSNGSWWKYIDKTQKCLLPLSAELTTTRSDTGGYYIDNPRTFPKAFHTILTVTAGGGGTSGVVNPVSWPATSTTIGCTLVLVSQSNTTKGKVSGEAIGTWA